MTAESPHTILENRYLTALDRAGQDHSHSDIINSTPRWDIQRWLIATEGISLEQVRKDLEKIVGLNPKGAFNRGAVLYILPDNGTIIEDIEGLVGVGFVRAATNPFCYGTAQESMGKEIYTALQRLAGRYGEDNFVWSFKEGQRLIDTKKVLEAFSEKVAKREFYNGGGSNPQKGF